MPYAGVTLTAENNAVSWDVLSNDEDYPRGQKLIIRQVLLGAEAKEDEFNVVEVCKISCAPKTLQRLRKHLQQYLVVQDSKEIVIN